MDFVGTKVWNAGGAIDVTQEYDFEDPSRNKDLLILSYRDLPDLIAGLAERAPEEFHDEIREKFEDALDRAQYEPWIEVNGVCQE